MVHFRSVEALHVSVTELVLMSIVMIPHYSLSRPLSFTHREATPAAKTRKTDFTNNAT